MAKLRILYFLEDRAQEHFITAMVERIAKQESTAKLNIVHEIRSARLGSRAIKEFKALIRDISKREVSEYDLLIVAIDGNCEGHLNRVKKIEKIAKPDWSLKNKIIYAVPDPHIERWYMMDQKAFKEGIGAKKAPDLAPYKCKKDYYKQLLRQSLKESKIISLLGGAEYGERIVNQIDDMEKYSRMDPGCQAFVEGLRNFFSSRTFSS